MRGKVNRTILLIYVLTLAGASAWLGTVFLAPWLRSRASPWAGLVYALFSPVCHQISSRSFFVLGHPLAVCARCLGIYAGFLVGTACYPALRGFRRVALPPVRTLVLMSLPIAIDTLGNFFRLWDTPNAIRSVTGVLWGAILPFYFITGISDLALHRQKEPGPEGLIPKGPGQKNTS
jgi:uncharacterized membrane protein